MNRINQQGISSLVLLFAIVLGVFIIWELNEFVGQYTNPRTRPTPENCPSGIPGECFDTDEGGGATTFCATGEEGNCNDSNDQFLFTE